MNEAGVVDLEPVKKLTKDLRAMVVLGAVSTREVRYLVDSYYQRQRARITADHQIRQMNETGEPHEVIQWLGANDDLLERNLKSMLDKWTDTHPVGLWAKSITGIGPVIAAGLLAHIDITRANTAAKVWAHAGLNPDMKWEKGQKRPFNMRLKTLCAFKLGESFVKVHNKDSDIYGKLYAQRKALEQERNDAGLFKETAARDIARFSKSTDAYKSYAEGKLPPARIHARARRYAVKMFLSHYHMIAFWHYYNFLPPFPFVFEHLGHIDIIVPPNAHMFPGLPAALEEYKTNILRHNSGKTPRHYEKRPAFFDTLIAGDDDSEPEPSASIDTVE